MAGKNGKAGGNGHRHEWQQGRVALEQKGGRVVAVSVVWECAGRRCKAETVTQAAIRKPAANARPKAENPGLSAAELRGMVQRGKERRRESGSGSLAAMEEYAAAEELTEEDFETGGNGGGRRTGNAEERRNAIEFLSPLGELIMASQAQTLTRKLRAAYRRADKHGEDPGCQPADFYEADLDRLYTEADKYREVSGVAFLDGYDADLMLYPDGSVAAFIPAVHPAEGGVAAITKPAHIQAARALLGV